MQESLYYKPGGELYRPDSFTGGLPGTPSQTGLAENAGILGGMDGATLGMGPAANDHNLQQGDADNTAVGKICIPA